MILLPFGTVTRPIWKGLECVNTLGLDNVDPPTPLEMVEGYLGLIGIAVKYYHPDEISPDMRSAALADEYLVGNGHRRVLAINKDRHPNRQRFSFFHGTGHALMPWHADLNYLSSGCTMNLATTRPYETEANQFAAILSMPPRKFKEDMASLPPRLSSIGLLAKRYQASMESAAIHYAALSDVPCCIFVAKQQELTTKIDGNAVFFLGASLDPRELGANPDNQETRQVVTVRYCKRSPGFRYYVRPGTEIVGTSNPVLQSMSSQAKADGVVEGWQIGLTSTARFHLECRPLNLRHNPGETIVMVRPALSRQISTLPLAVDNTVTQRQLSLSEVLV